MNQNRMGHGMSHVGLDQAFPYLASTRSAGGPSSVVNGILNQYQTTAYRDVLDLKGGKKPVKSQPNRVLLRLQQDLTGLKNSILKFMGGTPKETKPSKKQGVSLESVSQSSRKLQADGLGASISLDIEDFMPKPIKDPYNPYLARKIGFEPKK